MASAAVSYARTIRPFPTRRLSDLTYHVMADGNSIWQRVTKILIDPPGTPETWWHELQQLLGELMSLRDRIDELVPQITAMQDDADRSYQVAVDAMLAMLRGLQAMGEPPGDVGEVEATAAIAA